VGPLIYSAMPGPARTLAASLNDGDSLRIDMLRIS
jgi:hypothetical protein